MGLCFLGTEIQWECAVATKACMQTWKNGEGCFRKVTLYNDASCFCFCEITLRSSSESR